MNGRPVWLVFGAAVVLAGCGSLLPGPIGVEEGERTFTSEALSSAAFGHAVEASAGEVERGSVSFRALVVPRDTGLDQGAMSLVVRVEARNRSAAAVTLPVRGCTVWPEFHAAPERAGPPAWVPGGECAQAPYEVVLAPGEVRAFDFLAHDAMLAHGVEDGRYFVVAALRLADETLRLNAGSADVRLRLPGMAFHVRVDDRAGGGLAARLRVENRNPGPVHLEFGACAVGVELYRDAALKGEAIPLHHDLACPMYLAIRRLEPGQVLEARELRHEVSGRTVRGVPAGEYNLAVTLHLNWRTYRFPMGTVRVG